MKQSSSRYKYCAFTLTEVLLATAIVGVIAALILPALVNQYQDKALERGFEREKQSIEGALNALVINENKGHFFSTMMYQDSVPTSYEESSGKFIRKYLKVAKYCGDSNGDCFASKYYEYKDNDKKEYTPDYQGACASLKNGMSICITPQIQESKKISVILDLNGSKGPNILNKDLRIFEIDTKSKISLNTDTTEILATKETDLKPEEVDPCKGVVSPACCASANISSASDPCCQFYQSTRGHICYQQTECEKNPTGLECCKTQSITSSGDACCRHSYYDANKICHPDNIIVLVGDCWGCWDSWQSGDGGLVCTGGCGYRIMSSTLKKPHSFSIDGDSKEAGGGKCNCYQSSLSSYDAFKACVWGCKGSGETWGMNIWFYDGNTTINCEEGNPNYGVCTFKE